MTRSKIAVSLPLEHVVRARRAVTSGRAKSVSAYVASAIAEKGKSDDLADMLEEMLAQTGGPLSAAERDAADKTLGVAPRRKRRSA
jgi:Arc/MetJ-type ribon-helix-helix transcriptional regulator